MQTMSDGSEKKQEIYWVKTEDYPWWPAQVWDDLENDVQVVDPVRQIGKEDDSASEKNEECQTEGGIRVRLLNIDKECVYQHYSSVESR